tara:strand:+ start:194 stop:1156 length:963 start_codon:yes stop_codon:yes gene_type:complete
MLINKEDIEIKVDGILTIYTHTESNTSIEYSWAGIKLGSPIPIQVISRDDNGVIGVVHDFDTNEKGFWEAIDKFQELIDKKPPPYQCNELEEEAKFREILKESGMPQDLIEVAVDNSKPFCGKPPKCNEDEEESKFIAQLKSIGISDDVIKQMVDENKPFCGGKKEKCNEDEEEFKFRVALKVQGMSEDEIQAEVDLNKPFCDGKKEDCNEDEEESKFIAKLKSTGISDDVIKQMVDENRPFCDGKKDDDDDDDDKDYDLWGIVEKLTSTNKDDLNFKFRNLNNLVRSVNAFNEQSFNDLGADKKTIINQLKIEGQALFS